MSCHEGPTFSDNDFHVTGVSQVGDHALPMKDGGDPGRFGGIDVYLGFLEALTGDPIPAALQEDTSFGAAGK